MKFRVIILFVIVLSLLFFTNCSEKKNEKKSVVKLLVVHAGSLSIPFKEISKEFMKTYPEVEIMLESYGSRTAARQVSDLKREVDIVGSADSDVIRKLLYPEFADFCIDFTTNEMVLVYTENSKFKDEINSSNWYEVLMKEGVEYGHSNPNSDPCGYRAVLTIKLAENFYIKKGLYDLFKSNIKKKNIRPKEVDLLAMIEAGELDYLFIYRSVAEQHKLKYLSLPPQINLASAEYSELYSQVSVEITGKKPGEIIIKKGAPMVYGITIPKSVKHKKLAVKFIEFILGDKGREIMKANGQPVLMPPVIDNLEKAPAELRGTSSCSGCPGC